LSKWIKHTIGTDYYDITYYQIYDKYIERIYYNESWFTNALPYFEKTIKEIRKPI